MAPRARLAVCLALILAPTAAAATPKPPAGVLEVYLGAAPTFGAVSIGEEDDDGDFERREVDPSGSASLAFGMDFHLGGPLTLGFGMLSPSCEDCPTTPVVRLRMMAPVRQDWAIDAGLGGGVFDGFEGWLGVGATRYLYGPLGFRLGAELWGGTIINGQSEGPSIDWHYYTVTAGLQITLGR